MLAGIETTPLLFKHPPSPVATHQCSHGSPAPETRTPIDPPPPPPASRDAEPLTDDEKREWERILGKSAGDEQLFERKRRDAQANAKLDALKEQRKVAGLPRQPLLAEPGSVQLPRFVFSWLVGAEARNGPWSLMDVGLLVAVLGAFANDDASVFVGGQFDGEGTDRALVVPGGVGSDLRMHGRIAGSPVETDKSGHIRVRAALAVLKRNKWFEVEQTVGELRIRLGERARRLNEPSTS